MAGHAAHIRGMTDISPQSAAARENARHSTGQFGAQEHTAPDDLLAPPPGPEDVTYGIYQDGVLVSTGEKGAGMTDALNRARSHASRIRVGKGQTRPRLTIRAEGSDIEVALPNADEGRIVGWYRGDAHTAEELDARGISLAQLDAVEVEPYIDLGRYGEGELPGLEQWARDGDFPVSTVHASRDEETGGRHIDIDVRENFLWNAESRCPDEDYDDDSDLDPDDDRPAAVQRYDAWLTQNQDVVEEVYQEWFNADIDVPDTWETATVSLRTTVPYERFTESLVMEDTYPLLAKWTNESDPGSFGSLYVMNEVERRVEERERESAQEMEFEQRILREGR